MMIKMKELPFGFKENTEKPKKYRKFEYSVRLDYQNYLRNGLRVVAINVLSSGCNMFTSATTKEEIIKTIKDYCADGKINVFLNKTDIDIDKKDLEV